MQYAFQPTSRVARSPPFAKNILLASDAREATLTAKLHHTNLQYFGKMSGSVLDEEVAGYEKYPDLPTADQAVAAGTYKIKEDSEAFVEAKGPDTESKVWFRSPVSLSFNVEICIPNTYGHSP